MASFQIFSPPNLVSGRPYQAAIASRIEALPVIGEGGPGKLPDFEALAVVRPDLVLAYEVETANLVQKKLHLPVVVVFNPKAEMEDFSEVKKSLAFLGRLLGCEERAGELIAYIERHQNFLVQRTTGVKPASVYIGAISARGAHGLTSTQADYPPLRWVKARNVVDNLKQRGHLFIDPEQLLLWDPEYIFLDAAGLSLVAGDYLKNRQFYGRLSAVKDKKVFTVFPFNFYRANLEILVTILFIGKILYPERFTDIDPEGKAVEIIRTFVGADVYDWIKAAYSGFCRVEFSKDGLQTVQVK